MIGPGKYDAEATKIMESTKAAGVVVMVIGGDRGSGFSVQANLEVTLQLSQILRSIADQLDEDCGKLKLTPKGVEYELP